MTQEKLRIQDVIESVKLNMMDNYFREDSICPYSVIGAKLDHIPEGEWDHVENAVLILKDKDGNIHLFLMTCEKYENVIEEMFDTKVDYYGYTMIDSTKVEKHDYSFGHIVIDNAADSEMYLRIIKNDFSLENIRELKREEIKSKLKFPGWENINYF